MTWKNYNTEEVKELWKQEPDDNIVFRAATEDIEEYPQEIQSIIKEEAERRRTALANAKPIPKKTVVQKALSSVGLDYDPEETKDLRGAEGLIRLSLWSAILSASITLVFSVIACFGYSFRGITPLGFIDVVFVLSLAYGIYRKSRTCAVIVFVYWVVGKIGQFITVGEVASLVAGLFFGFFFFQGIRGTFAYHRLNRLVDIPQDKNGQAAETFVPGNDN